MCVEWGPWKVLTCALGLVVRVHDDRVLVKENQNHRLASGAGVQQRIHLKLSELTVMQSGKVTRGTLPYNDRQRSVGMSCVHREGQRGPARLPSGPSLLDLSSSILCLWCPFSRSLLLETKSSSDSVELDRWAQH